jgi:hypothetical protein
MADQDTTKTYVRDTRTVERSGISMPLIVGGLVVAVFFILWLVFGGDGPVVTTTPESNTTNVTVEEPAAPADTTTNVTIDPAPEAAAPDAAAPAAPADDAAPADGTAPAAPPANP